MLKFAVITVYYGALPKFYRTWLRSAQANPDIDFFIVTDIDIEYLPENVKKIHLSFEELHTLAEKKLGKPVVLHKHYKLCDYKPMYGIIFEDYLKGYDYWAHADMDLVFGNLQKFFDLYNIEKYERFMHLGHLSFYRNTEKGNSVFKLDGAIGGSWENVISTEQNCLFDEWRGIYGIYHKHNVPMFEKKIFADVTSNYHRFRLSQKCPNYKQQVFYWQDGGVFRTYIENGELKEEEFIYIHFKKRPFEREPFDAFNADGFFIGPDGFSAKKTKETTKADIDKYNKYPGILTEMRETITFQTHYFMWRVKSKLKKIFRKILGKK